jgi:hypothetical protein
MPYRFVIEKIDIDGDNIPDGDLVKKYNGSKLVGQKFVAFDKMKEIADEAMYASKEGTKQKVVYQRMPANEEDKPVIVKDATHFGQYVKAGAGLEVGRVAVDGLVDALGGLFSSEGGKGKRK